MFFSRRRQPSPRLGPHAGAQGAHRAGDLATDGGHQPAVEGDLPRHEEKVSQELKMSRKMGWKMDQLEVN